MYNISVWVSRLIPYLLKHYQVRRSLTVIFSLCMQCVSGKPAFEFSQSRTSIPGTDTFHFALSLSLACFTLIKVSEEGDAQTEKEEKR